MWRLLVLLVACRHPVDTSAGAATPEEAVRGALEAANRGGDPRAFLLDGPRCRALYASDDAPQISERGRAADEASCEQSATMLREELKRLPQGHLVFSVGVAKSDPFVGTVVPVTLRVDTDAFAPTAQWYALRVKGRYFTGRKGDVRPKPQGQEPARMTVAELRRAVGAPTSGPKTGDFVVVEGQYMGTDGDIDGHGDGHVWVGIVEDASAQNVEFTLSCRDPGLSPDIQPGAKLTASGVLHRDPDGTSLDPCFVK